MAFFLDDFAGLVLEDVAALEDAPNDGEQVVAVVLVSGTQQRTIEQYTWICARTQRGRQYNGRRRLPSSRPLWSNNSSMPGCL